MKTMWLFIPGFIFFLPVKGSLKGKSDNFHGYYISHIPLKKLVKMKIFFVFLKFKLKKDKLSDVFSKSTKFTNYEIP